MRSRTALLPLALVAFGSICLAQLDRASLSGTITDQSDAVVSHSKVSVLEAATHVVSTTETNESGVYAFIGLPPGQYTVTAESVGFSQAVKENVVLSAAANVRVDLSLKPGAVSERVEVKAEAPLVEQRSAAYGTDIQTKTLEQLPLPVSGDKRSPYSFLAVVPGVSNAGFQNNINGGVGLYSEIMVDGVAADYNPVAHGVMLHPPSVETIGEFRVVNTVAPEYGLTGGAFMSMNTKSGTNDVHGDAYEYLENNATSARTFFAKDVGVLKQNEFGFIVGGPVVLPKIYNGRNKTFFFGNFTQFILHSTTSGSVVTLPTDDFRSGDFSALLGPQIGNNALGRPILQGEIFDPASTRPVANGGFVRDPFPGNIIPSSRFSPVSAKFQSYLPGLTNPGQLSNNFVGSSGLNVSDEDSYFIKIDQVISQSARLSGTYALRRDSGLTSLILPLFFGGAPTSAKTQTGRMAYTQTFGSRVVNEFSAGIERGNQVAFQTNPTEAKGANLIGLTGIFSSCTPDVFIQGGYPELGIHTCNQGQFDTTWKFNDSVAIVVGKHALKFGGSYYRWGTNFPTDQNANGVFNFSPLETGAPGFSNTGSGYASFLLGTVDAAQLRNPSELGERTWYSGVFWQDEFRVMPKLTLTYGLRYELQTVYRAPHDDQTQFDSHLANAAAGGLPGALEFLGKGPGRNGEHRFADLYKNGWAPRIGFAYALTNKTAFRGSYGLFNGPLNQSLSSAWMNRQGFSFQSGVSSTNGGVTPAFDWSNGYPSGTTNFSPDLDPTIANGSATAFLGKTNGHPPRIQQINISIQHELPTRIVLEAAYIGNVSHFIGSNGIEQVNQLDYSRYASLGSLLNADIGSPEAVSRGLKPPFQGFTGTVAQSLRPYPQYLGINGVASAIGNSTYNALQVTAQKQLSNGLSFLLAYTMSKSLTDVDATPGYFAAGVQDAYNRRAEKSVSSTDSPNAVVASYTYELPVGTGKRFLNGSNPISKYVLGGWTISGIQSYRNGAPLGIGTNGRLPTTGDSLALSQPTLRPDRVFGVNPRTDATCSGIDPATGLYLGAAAFAHPSPFQFGNAARLLNDARGCGSSNENISLMKYFPLTENRIRLRLGVDVFNVFNRRNLGGIDSNIDDPGFGRIGSAGPGRSMQFHAKIFW